MIEFKEVNYKKFGKCIFVSDGVTELYATVDIGPRIICFQNVGGKNMFGEFPDMDFSAPADDVYSVFGDIGVWNNFGGHRLWVSPEDMPKTYFPDNKPCKYEVKGNTLYLYQNKQRWTNIEASFEITFPGGGEVEVCHKIKNVGAWAAEVAPWAISVMDKGGTVLVPLREDGPKYLPNRNFSLWTYSRLTDKRLTLFDKYILIDQTDEKQPFKIGLNNTAGYAAYFCHGHMFVKYFDYNENAVYPDGNCNFEAYTNSSIAEVESLGELRALKPGEAAVHKEKWKIVPSAQRPETQEEIDELVKKYVK